MVDVPSFAQPTVAAINGHICTLLSNGTLVSDNGDKCYQLSNGSFVSSATKVLYYSSSEISKIYIAGGILVIAFLVFVFTLYAWYMRKYRAWLKQKELEDRMYALEDQFEEDVAARTEEFNARQAAGENPDPKDFTVNHDDYVIDPTDYPPLPKGINKMALYVIGLLVIAAGIVIAVMP